MLMIIQYIIFLIILIHDNILLTMFLDTPRRLHMLHTFSWLCNVFGIFLILAAHEHYSIDVFIAFFITSRMFLYYHSLANNQALLQQDRRRTQAWFPLFSYFESKCNGIVPNQYQSPLDCIKPMKNYFFTNKKKD